MLRIRGPSRREILRFCAACGFALTGSNVQAASFGRAKRCLFLFLTGGPPQLDTWDLKPAVPEKIRGELKPIATNVPGTQISELFPRLADCAEKYCIVRSLTHGDRAYTAAGYTMLTGVAHPKANVESSAMAAPGPGDHPHLGSLVSKVRRTTDVPTFVAIPEVIKDAVVNTFPGQTAGFLGKPFDPVLIEATDDRIVQAARCVPPA